MSIRCVHRHSIYYSQTLAGESIYRQLLRWVDGRGRPITRQSADLLLVFWCVTGQYVVPDCYGERNNVFNDYSMYVK